MARARTCTIVALRQTTGAARATTLTLDALARKAGLHPQLVLRLVRLGLVEPSGGTPQEPLFDDDAAARLARAARLRRDLGIDYAGATLASELLARIERLEQRLRLYEGPPARARSATVSISSLPEERRS